MEKKTLMLASTGTLIGPLVGVLIGYFLAPSPQNLQEQINNLQNQINDLQNQIAQKNSQIQELEAFLGPIKKGAWNVVSTFEGSSGIVTTDYFYVMGTDLRLNWTWTPRIDAYLPYLTIYVYEEGQDSFTELYQCTQEQGITFAHNINVARYYLDLTAHDLDHWTITVENWIPE